MAMRQLRMEETPSGGRLPTGAGVIRNVPAPAGTFRPATAPPAAKSPDGNDSISAQLQAFIDEINRPLDLNDPYTQQILNAANNSASNNARLRGIDGPLSVANSQQAVAGAAAGLDMQRRGMGLQALEGLSGRNLGLGQLGLGYANLHEGGRQFDANMQYQMGQDQYNSQLGTGQAWGGAIGTGLGALGFLGGPVLGGALMGVGGSLGAGIGGMLSGARPPSMPSYTPQPQKRSLGGY
jgi:hypothetical protein